MASYGRCYSCILNGEELNMVAISCPWLALRRVKISEILREVHRRQNLRLGHIWTVRATKQFCHVFFPSNSRHCRLIESPASCAGKKIRRHQEKVIERKDIRSAVVRLHPSVMLMTLPWVSVPMSSRMRHLVGVAFWTRCPWRQGLAVNCGTGDHVTNMYM